MSEHRRITYTPPAPRYEHDCRACKYLGQWEGYDLYYCAQNPVGIQTVIARFGPDGDYLSGWEGGNPERVSNVPALAVARSVAMVTGRAKNEEKS